MPKRQKWPLTTHVWPQMGRVLDQEGHSLEACRFTFSEERKEQGLRVWGAGDMGGTSLPEFHLRRRAPRPARWLGRHMALALDCGEGSSISILPALVIRRADYCPFLRHPSTRK